MFSPTPSPYQSNFHDFDRLYVTESYEPKQFATPLKVAGQSRGIIKSVLSCHAPDQTTFGRKQKNLRGICHFFGQNSVFVRKFFFEMISWKNRKIRFFQKVFRNTSHTCHGLFEPRSALFQCHWDLNSGTNLKFERFVKLGEFQKLTFSQSHFSRSPPPQNRKFFFTITVEHHVTLKKNERAVYKFPPNLGSRDRWTGSFCMLSHNEDATERPLNRLKGCTFFLHCVILPDDQTYNANILGVL